MLRQGLSQSLLQKLSPQQIQLMKLLQIPTSNLEQRIQEELESNPALDEGDDYLDNINQGESKDDDDKNKDDDFVLDDYLQQYMEDDPISYKTREDMHTEEMDKTIPMAVERSFHEHLIRQIGMLDFNSNIEKSIARQIVGSIDEDGYLRREPELIRDDLMFSEGIEVDIDTIEDILAKIQQLDPPGIGSRDLAESLINQLAFKINNEKEDHMQSKLVAMRILEVYFDEFSKKHYQKLKKYLNLSESDLKDAIDEILKLNPKPASAFLNEHQSNRTTQYIVPDFIISNRDGELELSLNSRNAPDLRINDQYMSMLRSYKDTVKGRRSTKKEREAVLFIKQKIDSAKWFIDAIKQRQDTLFRTMYTIMQFQYDFFLTGDERRLKPMILKDIAEITNLDISTVSRVANSKFVQTEFGTRRLKDFFSESLMTQDGKEVSTFEVKNILTEIIQREQKRKPLSDEKLKNMLQNKGYNIARRTVAKYREQLNIPVARLRKEL